MSEPQMHSERDETSERDIADDGRTTVGTPPASGAGTPVEPR